MAPPGNQAANRENKLQPIAMEDPGLLDKRHAASVSAKNQRDEYKRTTDEVSKTKDDVKTGGLHYTRINPGDTCLLPGWRPA